MQIVFTVLVDCVLLLGAFVSLLLATFWGELCGIAPRRDKSGLGGFFALYLFLPLRWACTFVGLAWVLHEGTLPLVPGAGVRTALIVLGAHGALGVAVVLLLQHGLSRVQRDLHAGDALGFAGGVVLPLPGFWLAVVGTNPGWLGGAVAGALVVAALAAVLGLGYRHRLADLRRSAARASGT